jgi:cytochrome d ubiquinol oxidase subunit I
MEGVFKTSSHVPLHIGGIPDPKTQKFYFSIDIPDGLSLVAGYNANTVIRGLDTVPPNDRPNPIPIHLAFDGMVGSGFFALFIAALFWLRYFLRRRIIPENRWLLRGIVLSGILSFVAVELGWMVTEEGRQPWVIYGFLRTNDAVTTAPFLNISFLIFVVIYIILSITMIVLLVRQTRMPLPKMEWSQVGTGPEIHNEELGERLEVGV